MDDSLAQPRPTWPKAQKKGFFMGLLAFGLMLVLLFLSVMSWFFGSAYHLDRHAHNLKILVVDYDGGAIGSTMPAAYEYLAAPTFPTLEFASPDEYPDPASLRHAVCHQNKYWGALYASQGATRRLLDAAVAGNATGAYNASDTLTYIFDEARYPATSDSYIKANMATLIGAARGLFYQTETGGQTLEQLNRTDTAAAAAFLNPILANAVNMHATPQGSRVYLNTVNMVMPIISQFFFVLVLNGVGMEFGMMTSLPTSRVWAVRFVAGKVYSLLLSLVIAGYIWAFRESWDVHGIQFARTWMIFWLFMDVNSLIFESLIGSFVAMPFSPFVVLFWVLVNVSSTVFPFELSSRFYRIGYAFPAHETYMLLIQAWTGCYRHDYIALPVLFSWWVLMSGMTVLSTRKRKADIRKAAAAAAAAATGGPDGASKAAAAGGAVPEASAGPAAPALTAAGESRSTDRLSQAEDEKTDSTVF